MSHTQGTPRPAPSGKPIGIIAAAIFALATLGGVGALVVTKVRAPQTPVAASPPPPATPDTGAAQPTQPPPAPAQPATSVVASAAPPVAPPADLTVAGTKTPPVRPKVGAPPPPRPKVDPYGER